MKAINVLRMASSFPAGTQTVVVAQTGVNPFRLRGYKSTAVAQGSISPGTSSVGGTTITEMYFDEDLGYFILTITGAPDSGWTTMTNVSNGTSLSRASRTSFSSGTWTWTGQLINGFFTTGSGTKIVTFT